MMKKLPVGVDGFEKIRTQGFYYVDKTMFIAELLENWGEVNLFVRPRRFGKTLTMKVSSPILRRSSGTSQFRDAKCALGNLSSMVVRWCGACRFTMDMLKAFFEIGCDKSLFEGLKISREAELCKEYMGQFPAVSITLKSIDGLNYQAAAAALRRVIGIEALRFSALLDSSVLGISERELFRALIRVEDGKFTMEDELLVDSLRTLSQLLSKHYGKKVILFIDEYDVPFEKAFQNGYYDEMVLLIRNLFGNVLKSNPHLHFAVITGCLRISKESIFTGLNNLNVMSVTDDYFNDSFGFTDNEVRELLAYYGCEESLDTMRDWYAGYQFGGIPVYCPWDVIKYTQALRRNRKAVPRNYWANTSGNDLVRRFIYKANQTTKDEIEKLINNEAIIKNVREELTYKELDSSIDNLWSVLFSTGYLTQRGELSEENEIQLVIPNKEIRRLFIDLVKEWFMDTSRADLSRIEKFCAAFPNGDVKLIGAMLHDYLWDSISVRDTAVRKSMKENFYHGMVLGLLQSRSDWLIRSNAELGEGYSDILVCTSDKVGIIVELKYSDDGNLKKGCADALFQIEDRKYAVSLERQKMKKIIKYGMAFYEKECMVVMAE